MKQNFKIIDSHCHIYPDKIALKASDTTAKFYETRPDNDGTLNKLKQLSVEAGVDHIMVQSVATTPAQVRSINNFIATMVGESNGFLTGIGTLHPDSDDIEGDIAYLKSLGLVGVKLHADIQKIAIDDERCYKIYEILQGDLPILMHTGDKRFNFSNPDNVLPVLKTFKNLTVIGAHFGGWSVWQEASEKLSKFDNFYIDTSATLKYSSTEFVKELLCKYDSSRIMFGSDYPMFTPKKDVDSLLQMDLHAEFLQKIFYDNCSKLYKIKP